MNRFVDYFFVLIRLTEIWEEFLGTLSRATQRMRLFSFNNLIWIKAENCLMHRQGVVWAEDVPNRCQCLCSACSQRHSTSYALLKAIHNRFEMKFLFKTMAIKLLEIDFTLISMTCLLIAGNPSLESVFAAFQKACSLSFERTRHSTKDNIYAINKRHLRDWVQSLALFASVCLTSIQCLNWKNDQIMDYFR